MVYAFLTLWLCTYYYMHVQYLPLFLFVWFGSGGVLVFCNPVTSSRPIWNIIPKKPFLSCDPLF